MDGPGRSAARFTELRIFVGSSDGDRSSAWPARVGGGRGLAGNPWSIDWAGPLLWRDVYVWGSVSLRQCIRDGAVDLLRWPYSVVHGRRTRRVSRRGSTRRLFRSAHRRNLVFADVRAGNSTVDLASPWACRLEVDFFGGSSANRIWSRRRCSSC